MAFARRSYKILIFFLDNVRKILTKRFCYFIIAKFYILNILGD